MPGKIIPYCLVTALVPALARVELAEGGDVRLVLVMALVMALVTALVTALDKALVTALARVELAEGGVSLPGVLEAGPVGVGRLAADLGRDAGGDGAGRIPSCADTAGSKPRPLVKLCDFGFARAWGADGPGGMHTALGTPVYMSPQIIGSKYSGHAFDGAAADVRFCFCFIHVFCCFCAALLMREAQTNHITNTHTL
jgi:hypothetical protein